ncbi:hypothetical protein RND81_07G149200 [Saponaria officinalis]|uniref:Uncharacterized protein n=1 Tax=Saponaria officinalis TaxID=3572 RepID=A0AAW1JSM3_SAPOF
MAEQNDPKTQPQIQPKTTNKSSTNPGQKAHFPNPPETVNPDPATLREQWRFAIRQYSKWYSHAWGTAIIAGGAFFALGWIIKGGNPLPSKDGSTNRNKSEVSGSSSSDTGDQSMN